VAQPDAAPAYLVCTFCSRARFCLPLPQQLGRICSSCQSHLGYLIQKRPGYLRDVWDIQLREPASPSAPPQTSSATSSTSSSASHETPDVALAHDSAKDLDPNESDLAEKLAEAEFLIKHGGAEELETAKEILETVTIAYPGNALASELTAQLKARQAQLSASPEGDTEGTSIDPATELVEELGDIGDANDDFQISSEDVFAEFKKGVSKVVKPSDVDTHFDLGVAYEEMGLIADAFVELGHVLCSSAGTELAERTLAVIFRPGRVRTNGIERLRDALFPI
jgi:hypothetical protein